MDTRRIYLLEAELRETSLFETSNRFRNNVRVFMRMWRTRMRRTTFRLKVIGNDQSANRFSKVKVTFQIWNILQVKVAFASSVLWPLRGTNGLYFHDCDIVKKREFPLSTVHAINLTNSSTCYCCSAMKKSIFH